MACHRLYCYRDGQAINTAPFWSLFTYALKSEQTTDFQVEDVALVLRWIVQEVRCRRADTWLLFSHLHDNVALLVKLRLEALWELAMLCEVAKGLMPLHFGLETSAHLKQNEAGSIDVNFLSQLVWIEVLALFAFVIFVVCVDKTFLLWAQIHKRSS